MTSYGTFNIWAVRRVISSKHTLAWAPFVGPFVLCLVLGPGLALSVTKAEAKSNTSSATVGEVLNRANESSRGAGLRTNGIREKAALPSFQALQKEQAAVPKVNLETVKPPKNSAFVEKGPDDNARLERLLDQQTRQLYSLVNKYKTSPQRGELWLRLAELYVEKSGIVDARNQAAYDSQLANFYAGKIKRKPVLDVSEAKEYNRKAMQLYEFFARDFSKDPKMDQALFFLGYNSMELGDVPAGKSYYQRLIDEYPKSNYVLEANFALAETYFENEKWDDSFKYYYLVLQNRKHRLYTFSLYKASWCLFRGGQADKAIKYMESLIRTGRKETAAALAGRKNVNRSKLESEGLRDIIMMYAETGNAKEAPEYFRNLAGADYLGYVEKLAYYFADRGNRESARYLFNYLIRLSPNAPKNFEYQYQIVLTVSMVNKPDEFRHEIYQWIRDYGKSSEWFQANRLNKELMQTAYNLRETTIRNYVLQNHQTAQNTRLPGPQKTAMEGYQLYIQEFSDSPVISDMRFYYGELLFDLDQHSLAADQYRWVVENAPTSKFYPRALLNMVLAAERILPTDAAIVQRVGKNLSPVEFDPNSAKFVSIATLYLQKTETDRMTGDALNRRTEIMFKRGRLFYQHNQFEPAKLGFQNVIKYNPGSQYSEYSANLLLDMYNLQKDYLGLEKMAGDLLAVPELQKSKISGDLRDSKEKAAFKNIQALESQGELTASAKKYEEFALANPSSTLYTSSLFNAAINFEKGGQNDNAIRNHGAVIASGAKDAGKFRPQSRRIIAQLYASAGRLDEAADSFQAAAKESPKDPLEANLYFNAAALYEALEKKTYAIANYTAYANLKSSKEAADAWVLIGEIQHRSGRPAEALAAFNKALSLFPTHPKLAEITYEKYLIGKELGDRNLMADSKSQALAGFNKNPSTWSSFVAKIKLQQVEVNFSEMRQISIADSKTQRANVERKIQWIEKITKQLGEIIKLDTRDEIVASTCLLGQINLHMAVAFRDAPVPKEIKEPEQVAQYKAAVKQNFVDPFMTKAISGFKTAVDRGRDLDVDTEYFGIALDFMNTVDSKNYYYGGEVGLPSKQMNWNGQVF